MKRCRFGLILLILLLAGSLWGSRYMSQIHAPLSETALQAADRALEGDWGNALSLMGKVKATWEKNWGLSTSFADHGPMEQVNSLLAQLDIYAAAGDPVGFAAVCAAISAALDAIGDAQSLTWWNLL